MISSEDFAKQIRIQVLEMVHKANASHVGGALSMADILAVLYDGVLNIDPLDVKNEQRDRFLLSKGHACTGLYAALALKNFFPLKDLEQYAADGSKYLSHTSHMVPGVEISAGSLGHALPVAVGIALAGKRKNATWKVICLVSDGELNEGSNWEAILFSPQQKLDNLILIVDYNKIQSLGFVKDVIDLEPFKSKFESFNWDVFEIDGHNHTQINDALLKCNQKNNKPKVIIANTVKGKGVDFMENQILWHYRAPNADQLKTAIQNLNN